jgi:hypothetical protein
VKKKNEWMEEGIENAMLCEKERKKSEPPLESDVLYRYRFAL